MNPLKLLHIGIGHALAKGIAIIESTADKDIGKRNQGRFWDFGNKIKI